MDQTTEIQDLRDIKKLMERSSRFLSLSGLSGISAGIIALIGAGTAHFIIRANHIKYDEQFHFFAPVPELEIIMPLFMLAAAVLILALASGFYFSWRKAKRNAYKLWDHTFRRMLIQLLIPLLTGGIFSLILIYRNDMTLLASVTLIFYGLALLNGGKYTFGEVQYLGIFEIVLGLLAGMFTNYGLLFWAFGFGVLHILYGTVMYFRHDR